MARSKSNTCLQVPTYSKLSIFEQAAVRTAMRAYNQQYLDKPYFEIEEFYQEIYIKGGWFA